MNQIDTVSRNTHIWYVKVEEPQVERMLQNRDYLRNLRMIVIRRFFIKRSLQIEEDPCESLCSEERSSSEMVTNNHEQEESLELWEFHWYYD